MRQTQAAPYRQIDMRDWLYWLDEARSAALRAGAEHRQHFTVVTEAHTWHALDERMRAAGLQHLRDAPLFRAANQLYHDVYVQAGYPATHAPACAHAPLAPAETAEWTRQIMTDNQTTETAEASV